MEQLLSWACTPTWQQLLEWVEVSRSCTATAVQLRLRTLYPLTPSSPLLVCSFILPEVLTGFCRHSSRPQRGHHLGDQGTCHCPSPWMGSSLDAQNSSLSEEGFSPLVLLTSLLWGAVLYHIEFLAASLSPTSPGASNTPSIPTTKKHVQALPKVLSLAESPELGITDLKVCGGSWRKHHLKFQQDLKELISSLEIWISSRLRSLAAPASPSVYLHQQVPQEVTDVHFLPTCWLRILPERVVSFTFPSLCLALLAQSVGPVLKKNDKPTPPMLVNF